MFRAFPCVFGASSGGDRQRRGVQHMGCLHHVFDEPEHSARHHSVLHRLQAVPGQGDQRDSVQELSAKCETEEQAHTHR